MDITQIRTVQLDILTAIHRFCCENDIKYSLAYGTLLGAVRHKGYIPWDDDIDICLLRDDYNKLLSLFPETYSGVYKIVSLEKDPKWDRPYAKGYHCGTLCQESVTSHYSLGVCIDIFPIDAVPQKEREWKRYNWKRLMWQRIYVLKYIRIARKRSLFKNLVLLFGKAIFFWLSQRSVAEYIDRLAQRYNGTESRNVFDNAQGEASQRPFPKHLFDTLNEIAFEGRTYLAFSDADRYLTCVYGDWRTPPPVMEQITHHSFEAYWIS